MRARDVILLDTMLFILLCVGLTNETYIEQHKRLEKYDLDAFRLLKATLANAEGLLLTAHTLTEASNLSRYVKEPLRTEIARTFRQIVERATEQPCMARAVVGQAAFLDLGLTDTVLLNLGTTGRVILTDDFDLYRAAVRSGREVINFNHLRG